MASRPITSWEIDGQTVETVSDFILGGSKITADGVYSHVIKRHLLLGRKVMTNLDSILKSRDITLPTKVHLVKAMVFPVVMYGCEWKKNLYFNPNLRSILWGKAKREIIRVASSSHLSNKKTSAPQKKSYGQPRQHVKKQRCYFADKGPSTQSYGFSSSHEWMWELDYKES